MSPARPCLDNKLLLTKIARMEYVGRLFVDVAVALFRTTYFRIHTLLALENVLLRSSRPINIFKSRLATQVSLFFACR